MNWDDPNHPMRVRIFGTPWDAPVCEGALVVETPVGQPCLHCEELIEDGDTGTIQYCVHSIEPPRATQEPMHKDCYIRQAVGSVGHQQRKCFCFGGIAEDPPGMTKREAARAAVRLWERTWA